MDKTRALPVICGRTAAELVVVHGQILGYRDLKLDQCAFPDLARPGQSIEACCRGGAGPGGRIWEAWSRIAGAACVWHGLSQASVNTDFH